MSKVLIVLTLLLSFSSFAQNNLPDSMDRNSVPASEESREGELIDSRDSIDLNDTPAELEQREEAEVPNAQKMETGEEIDETKADQ